MRRLDEQGRMRTELLQHNAGSEPVEDARQSGYICCVLDILRMKLEDITEEN